jgi:DNA polymerase-3 subunit gamma/tau
VSKAEGVQVESEALGLIARAAEGSARDGLSILDQAIAHGAGAVTAGQVRDMLGLADRGRIRRLLQVVLAGDAAAALAELDEGHDLGIDPTQLLRGLMESLHSATRAKASASADPLLSAEERESAAEMARQLSWGTIHRLWQMLLKGLQDVEVAPDPREAAEMALLRLIHAADMPDPASLVAKLTGEGAAVGTPAAPASAPSVPTARVPTDFAGLVKAVERSGRHLLAQQLHDQVGVVRYAPPELVLKPAKPLAGDWPRQLGMELKALTGMSWQVSFSDEPGEPSLLDQEKMAEERVRSDVLADPNVRAVMDAFPDSELESFPSRGS